ncbi:DUF4245 domain-containing protein [Plantibacter sp. YIM 135347]|uniref:DUF4245 domain-containing protein n=1 Tax=Plantibacter sp. YIM 135347 TaxID=3423919 RepID=UPI003D32EAFF
MSAAKAPRVVAELGRPETPEETAARKAVNSRNHRQRQTVNNLVLSLIATVALVVIIVLAVPRAQAPERPDIDFAMLADQAQSGITEPLLVPELPKTWASNYAELRVSSGDKIQSWNIGLISPDDQFVGVVQGIDANDTWLSTQLDGARPTGTTTIDGVDWIVYANGSGTGKGNVSYAMSTVAGPSTIAVFGTASDKTVQTVAGSIADDVRANAALSPDTTDAQ